MGNSQPKHDSPPQLTEEEIRKKRLERYAQPGVEAEQKVLQEEQAKAGASKVENPEKEPTIKKEKELPQAQTKPEGTKANDEQTQIVNLQARYQSSQEVKSPSENQTTKGAEVALSPGPISKAASTNLTYPSKPPVNSSPRSKAELINDILEKVFEVSCTNRPGVKICLTGIEGELMDAAHGKPLLSIAGIDRVLYYLVSSPLRRFFNRSADKLETLNKFYYNIGILEKNPMQILFDTTQATLTLITQEDIKSLKQDVINYSTSLVTVPEAYDISANKDFRIEICEVAYGLLRDSNSDFGEKLLVNIDKETEEQELVVFMEFLFEKILIRMKEGSFEKCGVIEEALEVFDKIITLSPKAMNVFLKSKTFYNRVLHTKGIIIQNLSIFGAALSVSVWGTTEQTQIVKSYFGNIGKMPMGALEKTQRNLRERIDTILKKLQGIIDKMIRSNAENKGKVLFWFTQVLQLNRERLKIQPDFFSVSTEGFLLNVGKLLLLLCRPFTEDLDKITNKTDKINISYVAHPNFKEATMINKEKSFAFDLPPQEEDKFNFITEIYFLNLKAIEIVASVYENYKKFMEKIHKEQSRGEPSQNPEFLSLYAMKLCIDVQALDPALIENLIKFFAFSSILYLHHNEIKFSLQTFLFLGFDPNKPATPTFNTLSSDFIINMADILALLSNVDISLLIKNMSYFEILIQFLMFIMGSKQWLPNTHIRAKALIAIARLRPVEDDGDAGHAKQRELHNQAFMMFKRNECLVEEIIPALFSIYVGVEKTGQNTQFYDKITYRAEICQFLSALLKINYGKVYGPYCESYIKKNPEDFLSFVTKFFSGIIFTLDESLEIIKGIKKFEEEEEDRMRQNTMIDPDFLERKRIIEHEKMKVRHFLSALYIYYRTLTDIGGYAHAEFLKEEIRDKLVENLNYTINQLNGSQFKQLDVKDKKALNFKPKIILESVIELYIKFENDQPFLNEIARDSRSFSVELFNKTADILEKHRFSALQLASFRKMIEDLKILKEHESEFEEKVMEGCPEEFLDAIMGDIMKDPVKLPDSNQIVDRMVIKKHLLNEEFDPFNRKKLTLDMVIPQPELKQRIEDYIKEKTKKK